MKKIKIGINTLPLFDTIAGAERYTFSIIKTLAKLDKKNEYILFLNSYNKEQYSVVQNNFKNIVCKFPKNKVARMLYEQFILPDVVGREKVDILFSVCNIAPVMTKCVLVTMIFDLHWLIYPHFFDKVKNFYLKKMLELTAKRSAKILTLSESSKKDIVKIFNIAPEKVSITYCGSENVSFHIGTGLPFGGVCTEQSECAQDMPRPYSEKYILFVGQFHKRKNIPVLIKAFELIKEKLNIPHKLYLVGRSGDGHKEVMRLYEKSRYKKDIKIIGYILDEELALVYNNANIFIYPSLYEGFGLPVIEAMGHGVPVIISYASSLPEVGGDGALYFNPQDANELVQKMEILINNESKKRELVAKGLKQAEKFTWDEVGKRTLEAIEAVARINDKIQNPNIK